MFVATCVALGLCLLVSYLTSFVVLFDLLFEIVRFCLFGWWVVYILLFMLICLIVIWLLYLVVEFDYLTCFRWLICCCVGCLLVFVIALLFVIVIYG